MNTNHKTLTVLSRKKEVTINGSETVEVGELTWHAMLELLRKISEHGEKMVKDGKLEFRIEQLGELIAGTDSLARIMITQATGKDDAWLYSLTFSDALDVLDAALEINLSNEVMGKAKKVGGRLKDALGIKAAMKVSPMPPLQN